MKQLLRTSVLPLTLAAFTACAGGGDAEQTAAGSPNDSAPPAAGQTTAGMNGMEGMQGMPGMPGMQGTDDGMMAEMQGHMQEMMTASGDSLMRALPEHRQMTANMLARMNREMQGMQGGAEWDEAVGAVRQDLTRLPEMSAEELKAYLPRHEEHVARLMELHRSMMGKTGR